MKVQWYKAVLLGSFPNIPTKHLCINTSQPHMTMSWFQELCFGNVWMWEGANIDYMSGYVWQGRSFSPRKSIAESYPGTPVAIDVIPGNRSFLSSGNFICYQLEVHYRSASRNQCVANTGILLGCCGRKWLAISEEIVWKSFWNHPAMLDDRVKSGDTTLVSPLTSSSQPRRRAGQYAGAALQDARQSKERTYPELLCSRRCRLVGRWSPEATTFLRLLESWPRQKPEQFPTSSAKLSKFPSSHAGQPSSHMPPSMHSRPVSWTWIAPAPALPPSPPAYQPSPSPPVRSWGLDLAQPFMHIRSRRCSCLETAQ